MLIDPFLDAIRPHLNFDEVKVIVDIGSRDLEQSKEFKSVFPNATVYAFEANPESYASCKANAPEGIEVFPYALLDYDGETTFYAVKQTDNKGASSIFEPTEHVVGVDPYHGMEKIKVQARRFDTWAKEHGITQVDLAWVDVQGAEIPVFKGMGEILSTVKAIATEVETGALYFPNKSYKPAQYKELSDFLSLREFKEILYHQPWPLEADVVFLNKNHEKR